MEFLFPGFLWACLLVVIPIIIHLFYFRRFKKVYFTNVKFLKEVKEETSNRTRIKNLLVLLSRILAILALIFAFAQPFFSKNTNIKQGKNAVSIFVDNSYSMRAMSQDVPLIEKAKAKARDIVGAYDITDQFQVLTHALSGKQQRWLSKEDALSIIEEIDVTPKVNQLELALDRQQQMYTSDSENKISYILSDFQKSITALTPNEDTTLEVNLLAFQAVKENNVSIDSVWFDAPVPLINQTNKLVVKLRNHSSEIAEDIRLSIIENGQRKPEGSVDIPANGSVIDTINLLIIKSGWHDIEVIIDDYPIQFDDKYYLSFEAASSSNVLIINDNSNDKYLTAAFQGLQNFTMSNKSVNQLQYDQFNNQSLIILRDLSQISSGLSAELESYLINGGNVLVFPSKNGNKDSYNQFFNNMAANSIVSWQEEMMEVYKINTEEFVFSNVYQLSKKNIKLPISQGRYTFTNFSSRGGQDILSFRNGDPYLSKYKKGNGHLYVCAAPINKEVNDLVMNAEVFIPMLYKMSLASTQSKAVSYTIGKNNIVEVKNTNITGDIVFEVSGKSDFIPGQTNLGKFSALDFKNALDQAGYYDVKLSDSLVTRLAFNYNRTESNLDFYSINELKERSPGYNVINKEDLVDLQNTIVQKDKGLFLWKWLLIFALIFLALETLLLRFWKT